MLLTADQVVLPSGVVEPGLGGDDERVITDAGGDLPSAPADAHLAGTLVPGFVDIHCHGGGGASFTTGEPDDARSVIATHRAHGTTSLMASLVTDTVDRLDETVRALAPLVRAGELIGDPSRGTAGSAPATAGRTTPQLLVLTGRRGRRPAARRCRRLDPNGRPWPPSWPAAWTPSAS